MEPAPLPPRTKKRGDKQKTQQARRSAEGGNTRDNLATGHIPTSAVHITESSEELHLPYVVLGGGIAGVSCAKELARLTSSDTRILLISATKLVKETKSVLKVTEVLESLAVYEKTADCFHLDNPRIEIIEGTVIDVDSEDSCLFLKNGEKLHYEKLCICSGAKPRSIYAHPN